MWLELLVFFVGLAYGYMKKGRQDKSDILKTGIIWGLVIAVILTVLSLLLPDDQRVLGAGGTFVGTIVLFVVMTLLFVLGVWLGDWIEHRKQPGGA